MPHIPIVVIIAPWRFVWHGGRLADVFHLESDTALDAIQVGPYDWQEGKVIAPFYSASLRTRAKAWIAESSEDYARELPYLLN
jgi:hypothetical protein